MSFVSGDGIPSPVLEERQNMDNKEFNERRYNRKKQECRFRLGLQQFLNYPIINLLWVLFAGGVVLLVIAEKRFIAYVEVYPLFETVFSACMTILLVIFPLICAIGMIQFVGFCFAINDEANLEIVFGDKRDVKNQPPLLIYKKKDNSGVTKREFYTSIPMERWKEKQQAICDRLNIHLIGEISYGGKKNNIGNHICFKSAEGRMVEDRGVMYDDDF